MHDHADLAARLHGVDLLDAGVPRRDLLELAQALCVLLERLAARARSCAGQGVDDLHDHRLDGPQLYLVVVGLHRVRHGLRLAVAASQLPADQRMRPLYLVRHRLPDVVHQRGACGGLGVGSELGREHRREP